MAEVHLNDIQDLSKVVERWFRDALFKRVNEIEQEAMQKVYKAINDAHMDAFVKLTRTVSGFSNTHDIRLFLDDWTPGYLEKKWKRKIEVVEDDFVSLIAKLEYVK